MLADDHHAIIDDGDFLEEAVGLGSQDRFFPCLPIGGVGFRASS